MLQNKKLIQIAISALMAFLVIKFYLGAKEQSIESNYGMVAVLAAARDIPPHTQLTPELLTTRQVPVKFVEPGAIMVKIPEQAWTRVQGKVTISAIPAGTQIVQSDLNEPSMKDTGVAPLLPPGKRGYLLRLGNMDVADLILPGDHVDILATFTVRQKDTTNTKATYTILQNILVISVGRELRKSKEDVTGKKEGTESLVVTLALEPTEAERMALAQSESQGEISVIVRPHGDGTIQQIPVVTPGKLLG